jgi:hypothetical protein
MQRNQGKKGRKGLVAQITTEFGGVFNSVLLPLNMANIRDDPTANQARYNRAE